jgi:hypothetical protein
MKKEVKSQKVSSLFSERRMLSSVVSDTATASGAKPSVTLCWRVSTRRAGATTSDADRQHLSCVTSAASQAQLRQTLSASATTPSDVSGDCISPPCAYSIALVAATDAWPP